MFQKNPFFLPLFSLEPIQLVVDRMPFGENANSEGLVVSYDLDTGGGIGFPLVGEASFLTTLFLRKGAARRTCRRGMMKNPCGVGVVYTPPFLGGS